MDVPSKLKTDLILSTIFEIRFSTKVPAEAVFGILYNIVSKKYPNVKSVRLPILQLPEVVRNSDPNLKYQPHYQLNIDKRGIGISPKIIQFYVQKPYIGWEQWYAFITELLPEFINLELFEKIERTELRYVNFTEQSLCSVANIDIEVGNKQLSCQPMTLRTEFQDKGYTVILQLANDAVVETTRQERFTGSVIDLDIIKNLDTSAIDFQNQIGTILNESHEIEKKLFFEILRLDFLAELQPNYKEVNQ
jgi:uncharacterized protein (TIGR04255 family)